MPIGIILLDWDSSHGPIMKTKYTESEIDFDIEYLNIFLLHTATGWTEEKAQMQVFTQYSKYNLVSRYVPIIKNEVLQRIVLGVILETHETKPDKYYEILEQVVNNPILLSDDTSKLTNFLKELYETKIKSVSQVFTLNEVKNMIPLKTSVFREKINNKIPEIKEKFGDWALDFLEQLPQNLEVEKLEGLFRREENAVAQLIVFAAKKGLLRLVG